VIEGIDVPGLEQVFIHVVAGPTPGAPVHFLSRHPALCAVASDREHIGQALTDEVWATPGIYTLLGPSDEEGLSGVKVGKSSRSNGVREGVLEQRRDDWWQRAVVFVSNERRGFGSNDVGWLEGEVSRRLRETGLRSRDVMPQGDATLTPQEVTLTLQPFAEAVLSILNLVGVLAGGESPEVLLDAVDPVGPDDAGVPGVTGELSWLDAAARVMRGSDRAWHVTEILASIVAQGLRDVAHARTEVFSPGLRAG
jgi:hypothetical protein